MNRATGQIQIRNELIQKSRQSSHDAAFALAFFTQKQHVMTGQKGQADFGNDRVFIAEDAREEVRSGSQHLLEVLADLFLHGLRLPAAGSKFRKS